MEALVKETEAGNGEKISIVVPVYNEGEHIRNSMQHVMDICVNAGIAYELVLIDDGSTDSSWAILSEMARNNHDVTAVRLSRNFGKEAALCAGIEHARGNAVIVMDADLQHPPELIPEFVRLWKEGADVVEGVKESRGRENPFYRLCAKAFYGFIKKSSSIDLDNASDFKLLDRQVVEAMKQMPERVTFFRGMSAWVGFERVTVPFSVAERVNGKSKWSLRRLIGLAVSSVTSYTTLPLQCITGMGFLMLLCTLILGIETLFMKFSGRADNGFTTVILLLLFIGSLIMISLGIIGLYLTKIYHEIKARPRYLTSRVIRDGEEKKQ